MDHKKKIFVIAALVCVIIFRDYLWAMAFWVIELVVTLAVIFVGFECYRRYRKNHP